MVDWHTIEVTWKLLDDGLTGIDTFTIYLNSQIDGGEGSSYKIPNRFVLWCAHLELAVHRSSANRNTYRINDIITVPLLIDCTPYGQKYV